MFGKPKASGQRADLTSRVGAGVVAGACMLGSALVLEPAGLRYALAAAGLAAIAWLALKQRGASAMVDSAAAPASSPETAAQLGERAGAPPGDPAVPIMALGAAAEPQAGVDHPFRRLLETGPVSLALLDHSGAVIEHSGAFSRLAQTSRPLIGVSFASLFDAKDRADLLSAIAAADSESGQEPVVARLTEGRKETCAIIFTAIQDDPKVIAASIQDVTQEKKLEAQFAQSQKMLAVGQLAGGVAHDFNNLLTAIIGHADLLMLKYSPSDDSFADINQIKQNANRAANLVRQLLAFSRQQTLQPRVLDVGEALADLGNLLRRLLGAGVVLHIRHGRDVALVKVDRVQLEQVVINLAVNARDAMGGKGEM